MRGVALLVATAWMAATTSAHAQDAIDLQQRGEQLARDGRYSEAIDAFKAADRAHESAAHSCLIALAYTRRELWPQAEIYLAQCHQRANPGDPLPDWVPQADQLMLDRLTTGNVAPVQIDVEPKVPAAKLTVSSFAPDERFEPRTIHLAPGSYLVTVSAPGYETERRTVEIIDKTPKHIVFAMQAERTATAGHGSVEATHSRIPLYVTAAGAAILAGGLVYDLAVLRPTRTKLSAASDPPSFSSYDGASTTFDTQQKVTIGLYAVGAAMVVTGVVLRYTAFKDRKESPVAVAAYPIHGGGMVSVELR